jgi:hypothetical protein
MYRQGAQNRIISLRRLMTQGASVPQNCIYWRKSNLFNYILQCIVYLYTVSPSFGYLLHHLYLPPNLKRVSALNSSVRIADWHENSLTICLNLHKNNTAARFLGSFSAFGRKLVCNKQRIWAASRYDEYYSDLLNKVGSGPVPNPQESVKRIWKQK